MYKLIRTLLPVLAAMIATTVSAQSVSWKSSVQHLDGQTYRIVLEASIPAPWHMYDMGPYEGGPNATTITFTPGEGAVLEGGVEQLTRPERHYDKTFGMEIGTFARKAQFAQSVKLTAPQATVKAELAWMICNDTNCLPPDDTELTITLPAGATPAVQPAETPAKESAAAPETVPAAEIAPAQKDAAGGGSLWGLIIEAILWGFAALLTPCVFPMVPMTVSFFMKGSGSPALGRIRAGMYGFFIVALYTLPIAAIILITRLVGGDAVTADIFNWLATHWLPNILFFLVFMVFAASFFGAFEITMPSWMVNKTDSKADSKGLAGIFFMALTLVLVSFSCTGPIVGSVLIKSTAGEFWSPIVTMLAFSVAFALPFTLFAFFPSMLKKLPKSGGWLNSVKVVLGFIEVALGMKFLSVADQTYHWGLLDREIYLAVWIVTFSLLGLYLLGKIKFAHDSDMPYLGVGRLALAIVTFSLVVYLVPGMWGAPLKGLSGYLPPLHTQDGFFIVALYTLPIAAIILITRLVGGDAVTADIFNWLATHWLPNILFFLVFMVFAASFFGAFEITMPSWMVNKTDSKADSKGLAGIFFMALTLVLVSFSCTGPIVGSVLIKSTAGEFWSPIVTMLAFSVAFALPFTLFAFFPSMLKKLPKSGGWLNSVKVVLGFIEVALGMKFLSVADQTYHWGLLDREIYLAVWIVTFSLLGLYLLGKIKFAHDSDMPYLGVGRLALAIVTFSLVVYLVPGMWGAPLKGLSGYLPPLHTQDFVIGQQDGSGPAPAGGEARMLLTVDGQKPKHSDFLHLPHNLEGFFDLKEAEAYAAKVGKPLFIDFTGHGCVNCREMEARVWSDPQVLDILRNDYVIVALYSDDKKVLPESEWVTTDAGKVLKSLGKINSYYALKTFGVNAQPYYVLQGRGGKELVPPRGYDLDVQGFVDFLRSGVEAYDRQK